MLMHVRAKYFRGDEPSSGALGVKPPCGRRRLPLGEFGRPQERVGSDADEQLGNLSTIVGQSRTMRRVLALARQVAATDATVLLLGETGTGKEVIATYIHDLSARRGRAMTRVNCAAIPHTLIESELFGRERGAFTGAVARQIGRFEAAERSTILLDEIGDLPAEVQVKLLRVIEERKIERLGSPTSVDINVRIIAATHQIWSDGSRKAPLQ
jgi:transcriptional regulator with GAF, ATPase, and Fis domain